MQERRVTRLSVRFYVLDKVDDQRRSVAGGGTRSIARYRYAPGPRPRSTPVEKREIEIGFECAWFPKEAADNSARDAERSTQTNCKDTLISILLRTAPDVNNFRLPVPFCKATAMPTTDYRLVCRGSKNWSRAVPRTAESYALDHGQWPQKRGRKQATDASICSGQKGNAVSSDDGDATPTPPSGRPGNRTTAS